MSYRTHSIAPVAWLIAPLKSAFGRRERFRMALSIRSPAVLRPAAFSSASAVCTIRSKASSPPRDNLAARHLPSDAGIDEIRIKLLLERMRLRLFVTRAQLRVVAIHLIEDVLQEIVEPEP